MDWTVTTLAAVVAAVAALIAAVLSFASWRLQHINQIDNDNYKARLRIEERHFKLHVLWQDLRVAAITLQSLPLSARRLQSASRGAADHAADRISGYQRPAHSGGRHARAHRA